MTKHDSTPDNPARKAVRKLIASGLISQAEAARLTGRSRQLIRAWVLDIDGKSARATVLAKLWQRAFKP